MERGNDDISLHRQLDKIYRWKARPSRAKGYVFVVCVFRSVFFCLLFSCMVVCWSCMLVVFVSFVGLTS